MKNNFNLPDYCFAQDVMCPDEIIILKYGESGYYKTEHSGNCMDYNEKIGVTEAEMQAMKTGSMFGWDVPGANPEFYKKIAIGYKNDCFVQ